MAQLTSNSPFVYFASGTLTISSSANSGKPCGFYIKSGFKAIGSILGRKLKAASYIKVPEGEDSDNHGRCGPAFAVRAVEDEGWVSVLSQGVLHGLQELIKILKPRWQVNALFSLHPCSFLFAARYSEIDPKKEKKPFTLLKSVYRTHVWFWELTFFTTRESTRFPWYPSSGFKCF